jgi:hypothetical protein
MAADFDKMTEAELEAETYRLDAAKAALLEQQRAAKAALDRKIHERAAVAMVRGMTPGQRDAFIRVASLQTSASTPKPAT